MRGISFDGCEALESVYVAGSVGKIAGNAFSNCPNLKKVKLSEGINQLYGYSFSKSPMPYIIIPEIVTKIADPFGKRTDDFVICGYAGSAAQAYANDYHYTFIRLGNVNADENNIVDKADAKLLLEYLSGTAQLDFKQTVAARVTDSIKDKPDLLDAIAILNS